VQFNELKSGVDDDDYQLQELEEQVPQIEETNLSLKRSTRQRKVPDFYGDRVTIAETGSDPIFL